MKDEPDFIFKTHFYNRPRSYREPAFLPTLVSFEETGLLHRDLERLTERMNENNEGNSTIEQIRSLKNKIQTLQSS